MSTLVAPPFSSTRAYLLEARYEFLRLLRTPSFSLPCLLFPPVFYLLFGVLLGGRAARSPRSTCWRATACSA
jgi:ABC-2 type transport system permease protein